jgi:hypothetical protein
MHDSPRQQLMPCSPTARGSSGGWTLRQVWRAQAALGMIPGAARSISDKARIDLIDLTQYEDLYRQTGHPWSRFFGCSTDRRRGRRDNCSLGRDDAGRHGHRDHHGPERRVRRF